MTARLPEPVPAGNSPASFWLTRFILLRWLGAVYAIAFLVAIRRLLPLVGSHGAGLIKQMWFAAMSEPRRYPWTLHWVWKLLHDDPGALSLLASNPFPNRPPRYVRAVLYEYRFAAPGNPDKAWWTRPKLGLWLPPLSADQPELTDFLRQEGWLPAGGNAAPGP